MMIRVVACGVFKPEGVDQAISLYEKLAEASRQEPGCVEYVLCQDVENAQNLTVIEAWETEQALESHMQTAHFQELVPQLAALRESAQMHRYEQLL